MQTWFVGLQRRFGSGFASVVSCTWNVFEYITDFIDKNAKSNTGTLQSNRILPQQTTFLWKIPVGQKRRRRRRACRPSQDLDGSVEFRSLGWTIWWKSVLQELWRIKICIHFCPRTRQIWRPRNSKLRGSKRKNRAHPLSLVRFAKRWVWSSSWLVSLSLCTL